VIKPVHIQFVAALFGIHLKDDEAEEEFYDRLILLFGYVFLPRDEVNGFALKRAVVEAYKSLNRDIKSNVANISRVGKLMNGDAALKSYGIHLIRRLLKAGKSVEGIATDIVLPAAAAMAASHIQQVVQSPSHLIYVVFPNDRCLFVGGIQ
jgi:linoleate 10R-lipoxygenase